MSKIILKESYELLPLQSYLSDTNNSWTSNKKSMLLSKFRGISREIIDQLEMAGVFDTEDLNKVDPQIINYLGISIDELESMRNYVKNELNKLYPINITINQPLPVNFALVSISKNSYRYSLSMLWNGLMFNWSNPQNDRWSAIKFAFDKTFEFQDRPEIIVANKQDLPNWLFPIKELKEYIHAIDESSIDIVAQEHGFPLKQEMRINDAQLHILQLAYIIDKASSNTS